MDKPSAANAFTLVEMLLVFLILSLLTLLSIQPKADATPYFEKKMMAYSVLTQEKAFVSKQNKSVEIFSHHARFDTESYTYPQGISCTPISFHYNAKGNISQALSIHCQNTQRQIILVYQLGSGRVHGS